VSAILTTPIEGRSAWLAEDLTRNKDWIFALTDEDRAELGAASRAVRARGLKLLDVRREDFPLPRLGAKLTGLLDDLEGGRGYVLVRGIPVEEITAEDSALILWGMGTYLGVAESQDRAGNLLHHVRDTGQSTMKSDSVRSYQTTEEIVFHNDGADAFALLCLRAGRSGGLSKAVSAVSVFNELLRRRPDLAELAQQPFHFDLRAQTHDNARTQAVPIFNWHAGHMNVMAKRHYIDFAQRFPDVPRLSAAQTECLDLIDQIAADPKFCFTFGMQPGEIQIGNNYQVMHSRTNYVDHDDPAKKRHMLRLWLTLYKARPLPPIFAQTREFAAAFARRRTDPRVREISAG
jgi:hypothetical protein